MTSYSSKELVEKSASPQSDLELVREKLQPLKLTSSKDLEMDEKSVAALKAFQANTFSGRTDRLFDKYPVVLAAPFAVPFSILFSNSFFLSGSVNEPSFFLSLLVSSVFGLFIGVVTCYGVTGAASFSEFSQNKKLDKTVGAAYSAQVAVWLKKMYNIVLNDEDLQEIAGFICFNASNTYSITVQDLTTGLDIVIAKHSSTGEVFIRYERGGPPFRKMIASSLLWKGDNLVQPSEPSKKLKSRAVSNNIEDGRTSFQKKVDILRTLTLTVEQTYAVDHAEEESKKVEHSMEVLTKLNEKTSLPILKNSLLVLEKELDDILKQTKDDEVNRVQVQNFYLNNRRSNGVMLEKSKGFLSTLLRK